MEKGTKYKVIYKDDGQTRSKDLTFISESSNFITFNNERNGKVEILPINAVVRIEGEKENGESSK